MITHPVPQQISAFQFKLFGNLTIREFAFVGTGGLIGFLIFLSPLPTILKLPLMIFFAGGGAFAGLVPVQGRPFDKWLINFFNAIFSPTERIWIKRAEIPYFLQPATLTYEEPTLTPFTVTESKLRLEEYLKKIPTQMTPLDAAERLFLESLDFGQKMPAGVAVKFTPPFPKTTAAGRTQAFTPTLEQARAPSEKEVVALPKTDESIHVLPGLDMARRKPILQSKKAVNLASEINFSENQVIVIPQSDGTKIVPGIGNLKTRRLHSQPDLSGEINLPVKSERRFELSPQLKQRLGLTETESPPSPPPKTPTITISDQKVNLAKPARTVSIPKPESSKSPSTKPQIENKPTPIPVPTNQTVGKTTTTVKPTPAKIPAITTTPNVLSGIVLDNKGSIAEGAIILVKNEARIPVRALKTNKLGQFAISTPLPNGNYMVEVEKEAMQFDIIEIQALGNVMPPIEIRAK